MVWHLKNGHRLWYLKEPKVTDLATWFYIPIRFLLLNSLMIPISLKVTLDMVKLYYAVTINWDIDLYYEADDLPARAISTSIGEDLGQIECVFTDKTGTLTENVMRFTKCSIAGAQYPSLAAERNAIATDDEDLQHLVSNIDSTVRLIDMLCFCFLFFEFFFSKTNF